MPFESCVPFSPSEEYVKITKTHLMLFPTTKTRKDGSVEVSKVSYDDCAAALLFTAINLADAEITRKPELREQLQIPLGYITKKRWVEETLNIYAEKTVMERIKTLCDRGYLYSRKSIEGDIFYTLCIDAIQKDILALPSNKSNPQWQKAQLEFVLQPPPSIDIPAQGKVTQATPPGQSYPGHPPQGKVTQATPPGQSYPGGSNFSSRQSEPLKQDSGSVSGNHSEDVLTSKQNGATLLNSLIDLDLNKDQDQLNTHIEAREVSVTLEVFPVEEVGLRPPQESSFPDLLSEDTGKAKNLGSDQLALAGFASEEKKAGSKKGDRQQDGKQKSKVPGKDDFMVLVQMYNENKPPSGWGRCDTLNKFRLRHFQALYEAHGDTLAQCWVDCLAFINSDPWWRNGGTSKSFSIDTLLRNAKATELADKHRAKSSRLEDTYNHIKKSVSKDSDADEDFSMFF